MEIQNIRTIYMMGIGGIAMGTLATMLKEKGYHVAGSDQNLYPPMSTHLEGLGIPICQGYKAENIGRSAPDAVIIGNVIRRENPEALFVLEHGLPYLSMPEAISRFFLPQHKSIVVAGTHGKSTTSSLISWVLSEGGMDPSAFVGAFMKNWQRSYRLGNGPFMVLEGDEYDTAFFDKGPKFLHYQPHIGLFTSVEFDHADIFSSFEAVLKAFESFVQLIPAEGVLIVNAEDPNCMALSRQCKGKVITYGSSEGADWGLLNVDFQDGRVQFEYKSPNSGRAASMVSILPGQHNVSNTLAVMAAASVAGFAMDQVQQALLTFQGVRRRQDVVGEHGGVLVIDDFAHHPTAVHETIRALRLFHPGRRVVAVFEPRTNSSRRSIFQHAYSTAFDDADCICIKEPPGMETVPELERLNTRQLVRDIESREKEAYYFEHSEGLLSFLAGNCSSGDLVLCMSNGSFDDLPRKLFEALQERSE